MRGPHVEAPASGDQDLWGHNRHRDKPHSDCGAGGWDLTAVSGPGPWERAGEDDGHACPSVLESPQDDRVCLVGFRGEPSVCHCWWLALHLALCPALRAGLCLYALPAHPQEVKVEAGLTRCLSLSWSWGPSCQCISPWRERTISGEQVAVCGRVGALNFVPKPLFFRLLFILRGFPEPSPAAAVTVGLHGGGGGLGVESSFYFTI